MAAQTIHSLLEEWISTADSLENILSGMPIDFLSEDHPLHALSAVHESCQMISRQLKTCADLNTVPSFQKERILLELQRIIKTSARLEGSWSGQTANQFARALLSLNERTYGLLEMYTQPATMKKQFVFSPSLFPDRKITLCCENLAQSRETYDVVVCSAFKNEYYPLQGTLIGALQKEKNISVSDLAQAPQIDLRMLGCWLSNELAGNFRRIGCMELLDLRQGRLQPSDIMLKSAFSTLRFLLEQAHITGIPLRKIALPILGAGCQGIDLNYIIPPLYSQCLAMFASINTLESIDIYDLRAERIELLANHISRLQEQDTKKAAPVMISYNSTQSDFAHHIYSALTRDGIGVWIAPESIPTGSDYTGEITKAIVNARMVTLLYSPEAQSSPWVRKEIISAIGANKAILPLQLCPFPMDDSFAYMFADIQIFPLWKYDEKYRLDVIKDEVRSRM